MRLFRDSWLAAAFFLALVTFAAAVAPVDRTGPRDQWDAWCQTATAFWVHDDHGDPISLGYRAATVQSTAWNFVQCDDGTRLSIVDGHKLGAKP